MSEFKWDFDLVIFDLDGTLVDSSQDIAQAINATLATFGLDPWPLETIKTFIGRGMMQLVTQSLAGRLHLVPRALETFSQKYASTLTQCTRPYPGVREILQRLEGKTLAIMSNKHERFIHPILDHFELSSHFRVVAGSDTVGCRKPDPKALHWVCDRVQIPPKSAVMIGDSPVDVEAGKGAGMKTVGLLGGFTTPEAVHEAKPDLLLPCLQDLLIWLP